MQGFAANQNRVWRLCSQQRIWSAFAKQRGLSRKAGPPVHDDLVKRKFQAVRPSQLWLTGLTEHWTDDGKLHECAIKDIYSGTIVGYSIGPRMKASLAVTALRNATIARNPPPDCGALRTAHAELALAPRNRFARPLAPIRNSDSCGCVTALDTRQPGGARRGGGIPKRCHPVWAEAFETVIPDLMAKPGR